MEEKKLEDDELERLRQQRLRQMQEAAMKQPEGGVLELTDMNFAETIRKHAYVVVDFWAEWCGPCRMVAPTIEELAGEYAGRVTFGKCNVDENNRTAASFGISAIPTILFFANGQLVERIIGVQPKSVILARMERSFASL
ncbi:thioredoxin [Methanoculleus sp. FWC-SCC1]|uniref:Thioredoxin n=1 Tax=Methanoculleus frigidifontis TaxID=2584085 RepID=A0ABT8M9X1_9EURY|nr:thioredoxin [Methanoculleus sp. FWC-SCC1]MDN7024733.1 thioredoxin [Methanoculleus sp. FWC-SCC1]